MIISNGESVHMEGAVWDIFKDYARIATALKRDIPDDVVRCLTSLGLAGISDDLEMVEVLKHQQGFAKVLEDLPRLDAESRATVAGIEFLKTILDDGEGGI